MNKEELVYETEGFQILRTPSNYILYEVGCAYYYISRDENCVEDIEKGHFHKFLMTDEIRESVDNIFKNIIIPERKERML